MSFFKNRFKRHASPEDIEKDKEKRERIERAFLEMVQQRRELGKHFDDIRILPYEGRCEKLRVHPNHINHVCKGL